MSVAQARIETCGAKASGAGRLIDLAEASDGLFRAPRGLALPFGVMERCLRETAGLESDYQALQGRVGGTSPEKLEGLLAEMRGVIGRVQVPEAIAREIENVFGSDARLAIRSSANGEDLEALAGAGLYDSVVGVQPGESAEAVKQVWASIWTRRATLSRLHAGIPHEKIAMGVLIQALVDPELSFIMHTVDPATKRDDTAHVELAVGLGETLASASQPGSPYRLLCDRNPGKTVLANCASFSFALRPAAGGKVTRERLDYGTVSLSTQAHTAENLGQRLAAIASFLEQAFGRPQDVEGGGDRNRPLHRPGPRPAGRRAVDES